MNSTSAPAPLPQKKSAPSWKTGFALFVGGAIIGSAITLLFVVPVDRLPIGQVAAVLTAAAALLGVYLTNRSNTERLERQLQHDRELQIDQLREDRVISRLERASTQKKDVVFAAAEAAQEAVDAFQASLRPEFRVDTFIQTILDKKKVVAKVALVCDESATSVVDNFLSTLNVSVLSVVAMRTPLNEIEVLEDSFVSVLAPLNLAHRQLGTALRNELVGRE